MALDQLDRGFLEKEIDQAISSVKSTIEMARTKEYKEYTQITNESDFAFGWALGQIMRGFGYYYAMSHHRMPDQSEQQEIAGRINARSKEIKDAIFKCG